MATEKTAFSLLLRTLWLIERQVGLAARPRDYGTGVRFHRLDIHILESIGDRPGINVTGLADKHSITKSAVSQVVRSLEARGLIERYKEPENRKEVLFRLLEKGQIAFEAHRDFHRELEGPVIKELAAFSLEEFAAVDKFLALMERRADRVQQIIDHEGETNG